MKRTALILILLMALFSTVAGTQVVRTANANFYAQGVTPPPPGTKPPAITVSSPENRSDAQLTFKVTSATYPIFENSDYFAFSVPQVYYKGDWMTNESFAGHISTFSLPLYNVSIGIHTAIVRAEQGCFYSIGNGPYWFQIEGSTTVKFRIENTLVSKTVIILEKTEEPNPMLSLITIKNDGSIEPQTEYIEQNGNVYTLTSDPVQICAIKIQRSNIVFDGAGHSVTGYPYPKEGLSVEDVTNVTVKDLKVTGCIEIKHCSQCTIIRVKAESFDLEGDFNNVAESNLHDLYVRYSINNVITKNNITFVAIVSSSATFCENNFGENPTRSLFVTASWDNGSIGNYWSDYNGTDANGDGIGDTPYVLDADNQDRYPLMNPWDPVIPYDTVPPRIAIVSPENKVYNNMSVPLTFLIYEASSLMSYSLDEQDNATIAGNTTLSELPNGSHNLTVYVTDRSGNTGVSETIHFNVEVPEPFPTLLVVAVSVAVVALVATGILIYLKKRNH